MAFQAKISSLRFHHRDIVGWRLKKRTTKGVIGTSGPPLATILLRPLFLVKHLQLVSPRLVS